MAEQCTVPGVIDVLCSEPKPPNCRQTKKQHTRLVMGDGIPAQTVDVKPHLGERAYAGRNVDSAYLFESCTPSAEPELRKGRWSALSLTLNINPPADTSVALSLTGYGTTGTVFGGSDQVVPCLESTTTARWPPPGLSMELLLPNT